MRKSYILSALQQGAATAVKEYEYWSDGILLHECAGESFMVHHMATAAIKTIKKYSLDYSIRLEYLGRQIMDDQKERPRGRPPKFFCSSQRLDMAILDTEYQLKFAIEVKCSPQWTTKYDADLDRLAEIYFKSNPQRRCQCIFMAYVYGYGNTLADAEEKLKKKITSYKEKTDSFFKESKYSLSYRFSEDMHKKYYHYTDEINLFYKTASLCCIIG